MEDNSVPAYLTEGYRSPLGPYQREVEESSRGAHRIIDHIFGDKKSYLDPEYTIWDAETALRAREIDLQVAWLGANDPFLEVPNFITEDPEGNRALALFFAETYLLRNMQVHKVTVEKVERRVKKFLEASYGVDGAQQIVHDKEVLYLLGQKIYTAGTQFDFYPSLIFIWMAQLCITLADLPDSRRVTADPWELKPHLAKVATTAYEIYRNKNEEAGYSRPRNFSTETHARPFRIAAFPNVFEPINMLGDLKCINDYFLQKLGLEDSGDIDRNLLEIRRYIETSTDDNPGLQEVRDFLTSGNYPARSDFEFGEDRVILYDGLRQFWDPSQEPSKTEDSGVGPATSTQGHLTMLHTLDQEAIATTISAPTTGDGADWVAKTISVLDNRKQIIFYGPPGTGKTFIAQAIVESHDLGDDSFEIVQFHPSYTYEDFFEGYRPTQQHARQDSGQGLSFTLKAGPLKRLAERARQDRERPFFLIIDEINRGNIAKIFGELYFLLEYRDKKITLQYSDEQFSLPENLFIIGTMNTVDRSIATVDAAIRRRFAFIELSPRKEPGRGTLARAGRTVGAALQQELNTRLSQHNADLQVGHSYFFGIETQDEAGQVWEFDILPLLVDHFYGVMSEDQVEREFALSTFLADPDVDQEDPDQEQDAPEVKGAAELGTSETS